MLISIEGLARDWAVSEETVEKVCRAVGANRTIRFEKDGPRYINLFSLEWGLFEATVPKAMEGDKLWLKTLFETQGVIYGTLSKEVIRERVKKLAESMRPKKKRGRPKRK